jgi:hypothetical protein
MMMSAEGAIMYHVELARRAKLRYEEALYDFRNNTVLLEQSRHKLEGAKISLDDALGRNVLFGSPTILASLESVKGEDDD